jgi:hypothetical protein
MGSLRIFRGFVEIDGLSLNEVGEDVGEVLLDSQ